MKAAVILSGCGHKDGTEVHEAVLSFLAFAEVGIEYQCFAPEEMLFESEKIARDKLSPLTNLKCSDYDMLWMPGGMGAAKHLSTFEKDGNSCTVDSHLRKALEDFHNVKKPIVAICFAPVIVAKVFEGKQFRLTLGSNPNNSKILENLGAKPVSCKVNEYCYDEINHIYTTPAFMEPPNIKAFYGALTQIVATFA